MKDWCHTKNYFAGILLGMPNCASYLSRTHDVIGDVTRSQNRSNFEITISPSIFELERRSKAQNVGNANGYLSGILDFRYHFRKKKFVVSSKWCPFWKFWNIKHSFNLASDMKRSSEIMLKSIFHDDDVSHDVTGWPQSRPSLFLYELNNIFHNWKMSKDVIIKLPVHTYHETMTTFI